MGALPTEILAPRLCSSAVHHVLKGCHNYISGTTQGSNSSMGSRFLFLNSEPCNVIKAFISFCASKEKLQLGQHDHHLAKVELYQRQVKLYILILDNYFDSFFLFPFPFHDPAFSEVSLPPPLPPLLFPSPPPSLSISLSPALSSLSSSCYFHKQDCRFLGPQESKQITK